MNGFAVIKFNAEKVSLLVGIFNVSHFNGPGLAVKIDENFHGSLLFNVPCAG
jgi:hypothetical protein